MRHLRMGFCGGCLSHQRDIPLNQLFHRVLSESLTREWGIRLRLVIARDFERSLAERVAGLLGGSLDLLLLHVRSLPAVPNSRWFAKEVEGERASLVVNPRFVAVRWVPALRKLRFDYRLRGADRSAGDDMAEGSYNRGSPANQANVAAGLIFGVAGRAIQETVQEARSAIQIAQRRGLPFFVMGPPPSTQAGRPGNAVCARLNRAMERESRERGFPYIDLFPGWEDAFLMWDGLHLTPGGHHHIASRLEAEIGAGVAAIAGVGAP
jgi:hypothetical protein